MGWLTLEVANESNANGLAVIAGSMLATDAETQALVDSTIPADQEIIANIPELSAHMIGSNLPKYQLALMRIEARGRDCMMDDNQSHRYHEPGHSRRDGHRTPGAAGNNLAQGQSQST